MLRPMAPRSGEARPRSLVLYAYGGFVRRLGGWIAVADMVSLMAALGVGAASVRAVLARMERRGLLAGGRRAGVDGYALTPRAWAIFDEGDRRMLAARRPAALAEGWVLVVFSIPESQRDARHQIRGTLTWLGFGTLAPGVWIAPRRLRQEGHAALAALEHEGWVELLDVSAQELDEARRLVARCWDLDALAAMYREFSAAWEPVLERWTAGPGEDGRAAFTDTIRAMAGWRKLPFLDPGLPAEVLPAGWEGERAAWIYFTLLGRLDAPATAWVTAMVDSGGRT
jgi:phenylacetic acid degradation operon negative regulatory protein